jgi:hypothetical protein
MYLAEVSRRWPLREEPPLDRVRSAKIPARLPDYLAVANT